MASTTSTLFVACIAALLVSNINLASAEPSPSLSDILFEHPNITGGPAGEIKCYALPYGAIGIISHLLTDWTIVWIAFGRVPLWPQHQMDSYKFDMFLAGLSLCTCVPIASITMQRCRLSWHFLLICIWKLITSVSLACITLHRCMILRKKGPPAENKDIELLGRRHHYQPARDHDPNDNGMYAHASNRSGCFSNVSQEQTSIKHPAVFAWFILYVAGTIIGMVGLGSLLYTTFRDDQTIRKLTYGFGAAIVILAVSVAIYWYSRHSQRSKGGFSGYVLAVSQVLGGSFLAFTVAFGFFCPLYSDLVLGKIADNIFGLPSQDFAPLYWAWFIAKRLPLLSF